MRKKNFAIAASGALILVVGAAVPAYAYPDQNPLHPDTGAPGTGYTVGVSFQDDNGGGGAITWKGGAPCTASYGNTDYSESSLSQEAANDEISSFTDFNYCDTKFFWNSSFGGNATAWLDGGSSPDNLGSQWSDESSSIKWS